MEDQSTVITGDLEKPITFDCGSKVRNNISFLQEVAADFFLKES